MIEETSKGHVARCDLCPHEEEYDDYEDFHSVVNDLKELGWSVVKLRSVWYHHCPVCSSGGTGQQSFC